MAIRFIYKLINPIVNKPFYVGQTINTHKRLLKHIRDSISLKYPHHKTICKIINAGLMPLIKVIEKVQYSPSDTYSIDEVCIRERFWIKKLSKQFKLDNTENNEYLDKGKKECLKCGDVFNPTKPKQVYCSDRCRTYAYRERQLALKNKETK